MNGRVATCIVLGSLVWVASVSAAGVNVGYYSQQTTPGRAEAGSSVTVSYHSPGSSGSQEGSPPASGISEGGATEPASSSAASSANNGVAPCVVAGESNVSPCYGVVPGPAPAAPGQPAAGPARPSVNPAVLAAAAADRLSLGPGAIRVSPSARVNGLTGAPSWFWLEPSPGSRSLSVALRGEHVTVSASAKEVLWAFGDGQQTAGGAGVPYRPGPVPTGAVRHAYQSRCLPGDRGHDPNVLSSCGGAGYTAAANVVWAISYQATGPVSASGVLPARTTTTSIAYPVSEARAFLTASGGAG